MNGIRRTTRRREEIPRSALIVRASSKTGLSACFRYSATARRLQPERSTLLEALALAAAAMANARLYEQAQVEIAERRRAEQSEREQRTLAEALSHVAALLNRSLDLEEVLGHILTHVGHVVPYDAAYIGLVEDGVLCAVRCHGYERYDGDEAVLAMRLQSQSMPACARWLPAGTPTSSPMCTPTQAGQRWPSRTPARFLGAPIIVRDTCSASSV